jgi:thiamine-monophosphate kinase
MSLGEFDLIEKYFSRKSKRSDVLLGIGDDAAVLSVPERYSLVAATDTLVEGRHFLPGAAPESVGHRALAVNLSDLAAMGAEPAWALLALSLPEADETWLAGFVRGLLALADRFGVDLVGGDTVRGPLVITVQIMGLVPQGKELRRSTARPGDRLFVSGWPGESAAGLALLQESDVPKADPLMERFLFPEPRLDLGNFLREHATSAMDVSDGLLGDLAKLCLASDVAASIDLERLPYSKELRRRYATEQAQDFVLRGGDDYELLFTLPPDDTNQRLIGQLSAICPVTEIGRIEAGRGVRCLRSGRPVETPGRGYDHFA